MTRIPIYPRTDPARIRELADDPTLELDISAFINPKIVTAFYRSPLPDTIRAGLYTENNALMLPLMVSCGNIAAPNAASAFLSKLEAAGHIDMPKVRNFHLQCLRTAGNIYVASTNVFHAPVLEHAGHIDVQHAVAFYAPLLANAGRIYAEDVYDYNAPLLPPPVDIEGRPMELLHGRTNLANMRRLSLAATRQPPNEAAGR